MPLLSETRRGGGDAGKYNPAKRVGTEISQIPEAEVDTREQPRNPYVRMRSSDDIRMTSDGFQRWQKITIDHLGYAQNLILTFTVAALGYWFVLLRDKEFTPSVAAKYMMRLALITLGVSAFSGLYSVVNRLWDFSGTARRARDDSSPDAPSKAYLDKLGKITWGLFYCQIITFTLGMILMGIALLLTDGGRL